MNVTFTQKLHELLYVNQTPTYTGKKRSHLGFIVALDRHDFMTVRVNSIDAKGLPRIEEVLRFLDFLPEDKTIVAITLEDISSKTPFKIYGLPIIFTMVEKL